MQILNHYVVFGKANSLMWGQTSRGRTWKGAKSSDTVRLRVVVVMLTSLRLFRWILYGTTLSLLLKLFLS